MGVPGLHVAVEVLDGDDQAKAELAGELAGGWVVNTSLDTLAGVMAKGLLVAVTGPSVMSVGFRVYPVQAVVIWRLVKVATPAPPPGRWCPPASRYRGLPTGRV